MTDASGHFTNCFARLFFLLSKRYLKFQSLSAAGVYEEKTLLKILGILYILYVSSDKEKERARNIGPFQAVSDDTVYANGGDAGNPQEEVTY